MVAIETKFIPCTNYRASRVSATSGNGQRIVLQWDDALNAEENHRAAAMALRDKMKWKGEFVTGGLKNSYVHVFVG